MKATQGKNLKNILSQKNMILKKLNQTLNAEHTRSDTKLNNSEKERIENIKDKYSGPVFIVASGASAAEFPLNEFSSTPMITMNGAISMFHDANIAPLFYACTDPNFPHEQPELFKLGLTLSKNILLRKKNHPALSKEHNSKLIFIEKATQPTLTRQIFNSDDKVLYQKSLFSKRNNSIGFSKDLVHGWVDARTVAYVCLQLAYHLGFDTVIMVGFDLNTSQARFYENPCSKKSPISIDRHYENRIIPSLQFMKERIINKEFTVHNLSENSKVPKSIIPKITIEQARELLL